MPLYSAPVGDTITVNADLAGAQERPQIVPLTGGGHAVLWHDTSPGGRTVTEARIFAADGTPLAPESSVLDDILRAQSPFAAIADAAGGVLAVDTTRSLDVGGDIEAQTVDSAGGAVGDPIVVNTLTSSIQRMPDAARLANGSAVVVWESLAVEGTFADLGISARSLTAGGTGGAEIRVNTTTSGDQTAPQVASLAGGGFVTVWNGPEGVYGQRFDAAGAATGSEFRIDSVPPGELPAGGVHVEGLGGGGFLTVWNQAVGGTPRYFGQVFDASGARAGGTIAVSTTTEHDVSGPPSITALSSGGALVAWGSNGLAGGVHPPGFYMQRITADGRLEGGETLLYDSTGIQSFDVTLVALPDGDVLAAWSAVSPDDGRGDIQVQYVITAGEIDGTDAADRLRGADGADRIRGFGGDDTILGFDGADTLIGGAGHDSILGGESASDLRDVIYGGDGNDVIDGGYGNDELRGDAGNDYIAGGFGADTVIGGTGDDTLTGSAFGDLIFGGDGFDFINGGFGSDRVNGGAGGDRLFHLGIADHGNDWIQDYSSAEGDVLVYGGSATRSQFQVNVTTTPTAGADTVQEAFVIYRPTGQILWALVDGDGQDAINLSLGGQVFDLMG
ncbi:calcium-binding protein [Palleronia pelagia]|uniref:Hemolysin-type calcium-binding repeat-containing protein n=1 Tax=Palleronia pelagia TaxID=387096 RepID=A0A1H8KD88_9RHOB|nr:calcium-binding protein [Palleronia pelagia]SEN90388.1 Hemolysin-type calcium-binding repeat-containing protein [Palleronia pelagia]